jgi:hypothetical protein
MPLLSWGIAALFGAPILVAALAILATRRRMVASMERE